MWIEMQSAVLTLQDSPKVGQAEDLYQGPSRRVKNTQVLHLEYLCFMGVCDSNQLITNWQLAVIAGCLFLFS